MKKQLYILVSILCLIASGLISQTVYITNTGEKYHNESCWTLSKSKIAIDLKDASAKGYEACKICKPEQPANNNASEKQQETKSANAASVQCSSTTKAGNRCKRITKSSNGKCWQHGGN